MRPWTGSVSKSLLVIRCFCMPPSSESGCWVRIFWSDYECMDRRGILPVCIFFCARLDFLRGGGIFDYKFLLMPLNVKKVTYSLLPVLFLLSPGCQQKEQDSKKFSNYSGLNLQPVISQRKNEWKEEKGTGEVISFNLQEGQRYYRLSNLMDWQGYTLLSDSVLVGTVDEVTFWNDRIFIFDHSVKKSVHCFAMDGSHLFSIDRPGEGPGEFMNLCGYAINERNGNLLLLDNYTIIKFDQNGEFLQEVRIPLAAEDLEVSEDGKYIYLYVVNNSIPSHRHTFNMWVITNEKGAAPI